MTHSPPPCRPHIDQSYSFLSFLHTLFCQTHSFPHFIVSWLSVNSHKCKKKEKKKKTTLAKYRLTVRWLCSTWWHSLREWRTPRWQCGCFLFLCQRKAICSGRAGGSMWFWGGDQEIRIHHRQAFHYRMTQSHQRVTLIPNHAALTGRSSEWLRFNYKGLALCPPNEATLYIEQQGGTTEYTLLSFLNW